MRLNQGRIQFDFLEEINIGTTVYALVNIWVLANKTACRIDTDFFTNKKQAIRFSNSNRILASKLIEFKLTSKNEKDFFNIPEEIYITMKQLELKLLLLQD